MSSSTKSLTEGPLAKQILLVSLQLVLGSSVYSRDIDAAAAQNPDGSIGVSIVSYTDAPKQIAIRLKGQICQTTIQGKGLFTVLFTDGQ